MSTDSPTGGTDKPSTGSGAESDLSNRPSCGKCGTRIPDMPVLAMGMYLHLTCWIDLTLRGRR